MTIKRRTPRVIGEIINKDEEGESAWPVITKIGWGLQRDCDCHEKGKC
jgi:hypothetical protein